MILFILRKPSLVCLNQIVAKAHTLNALDVQRYDENCRKLDEAVKTITAAVILPRPMK